jgi:7tm Odorant receptor
MVFLSSQSLAIGAEAYNLKWYNRSAKFLKLVAIVIARSQDEKVAITAGKFHLVDLENYGQVLQSSFAYYALINSVYSGN